ncbi:MAG: hypothetical protein KatS3mg068_0622 [Candidatus Sericytochromatia bacterium]|nr:MAG: hypothetical protein KatS3mg068_0622 [Candidatus Sericytochromatia bacterium]
MVFSNKSLSLVRVENLNSDYGDLPELKYNGNADLIAITQNETSTGSYDT